MSEKWSEGVGDGVRGVRDRAEEVGDGVKEWEME